MIKRDGDYHKEEDAPNVFAQNGNDIPIFYQQQLPEQPNDPKSYDTPKFGDNVNTGPKSFHSSYHAPHNRLEDEKVPEKVH